MYILYNCINNFSNNEKISLKTESENLKKG